MDFGLNQSTLDHGTEPADWGPTDLTETRPRTEDRGLATGDRGLGTERDPPEGIDSMVPQSSV